jgi:UDP:flavonoid glycosyltransferase YjiC (YdhE family)
MLQSASDPSVTPPAPYWPGPRTGLALAYNRRVRGVVRRVIRGLLAPLRAFRIQIGLPPTRQDYFFDFGQPHAAAAVLGLYSPAFAPAQSDQPARLTLTGFTAYDGAQALDPALAAFLSAGPPPIVFSLGSFAVFAPGDFYRDSLAAARTLGRRAVLLTGEAEATRLGPADGPDVFISAYAPHAGVFPHAAAIVHHGGIGTTAQALRAGRPQLVTPFLGDQPDNAARLVRLGVARQLAPRRYDARRAVVELGRLLDDARHAQAAQAIAPTFRAETGAQVAADAIEALAPGVHTA